MSNGVLIHITPETSLVDSAIELKIIGLTSKQHVTVRLRRPLRISGVTLESYAVFQADETGIVDLQSFAPLKGTYQEVDGMGLFWSMQRISTPTAPSAPKTGPIVYTMTVECNDLVLAERQIERNWLATGVKRTPVLENGLVATYFHHEDELPRPGILVLGGSEGGLNESIASLIASHGYSTLALAYFGAEHLPAELVNIPLEYVESAIHWFSSQPGVRGDWLGVHGTSKGGELAVLAASMFPQIKSVVCLSSGGVVFHGIQAKSAEMLPPAWTFRGKPLSYASETNPYHQGKLAYPTSKVVSYRAWYEFHTSDPAVLERATIPVENLQGGVLFISGQDDLMFHSEDMSQLSMERLKRANHPHRYEHLVYPAAGHAIWVPYLLTSTRNEVPSVGRIWEFGGTVPATARASIDSWARTLQFFSDESRRFCLVGDK